MGDRFGHLQKAIDMLFERVGAIVEISSVYETPAMGFDGASFLNCAVLMKTEMDASQILKSVLEIERNMGRERNTVGKKLLNF